MGISYLPLIWVEALCWLHIYKKFKGKKVEVHLQSHTIPAVQTAEAPRLSCSPLSCGEPDVEPTECAPLQHQSE